jgi:hypothetical protein
MTRKTRSGSSLSVDSGVICRMCLIVVIFVRDSVKSCKEGEGSSDVVTSAGVRMILFSISCKPYTYKTCQFQNYFVQKKRVDFLNNSIENHFSTNTMVF